MTTRADMITEFLCRELAVCEQFPLKGDASFRRYIRVKKGDESFMLMDAPPEKEDVRPFINISRWLVESGFSAPRILAADPAQGFLLLEDLGDDTYSRLLQGDPSHEEEYYKAAVDVLAEWHTGDRTTESLGLVHYDHALLLREVLLLSNWFLPQILDGDALASAQVEYAAIWSELLTDIPLDVNQFVHRDYHADNLMWLPDRHGVARVGQLDFQDAVLGDAAYDMVSLLEDARRDVPPALVEKMLAHYISRSGCNTRQFTMAYALLAAQRNSKIVGIFTRLAARDGKLHYLDYLPRVWAHLTNDLMHGELAPLKNWFDRHVPPEHRGIISIRKNAAALGLAA